MIDLKEVWAHGQGISTLSLCYFCCYWGLRCLQMPGLRTDRLFEWKKVKSVQCCLIHCFSLKFFAFVPLTLKFRLAMKICFGFHKAFFCRMHRSCIFKSIAPLLAETCGSGCADSTKQRIRRITHALLSPVR